MGSEGLFNGTISTLENALNLRGLKHSLIVSNIANKDTPQYKAFDLAVEEEMKKIGGENKDVGLTNTHSGHLPGVHGSLYTPEVTTKYSIEGLSNRADGNTVNIDGEITKMAENSILYDAMTQLIHKKFQSMKNVIQSGGK